MTLLLVLAAALGFVVVVVVTSGVDGVQPVTVFAVIVMLLTIAAAGLSASV